MSDEPPVDPTDDDATTPEGRRVRRVVPKSVPEPEPQPEPAPAGGKREVTKARRTFWALGLAAGGYMIIRGLYGVITGEEGTP